MSLKETVKWVGLLIMAYIGVCYMAYGLSHPEQTQTQVLFNFVDAVLWRW